MKFHKFISIVLHPVVMPTIGVLLYFLITPLRIPEKQQYLVLGIVFLSSYVLPIILLVLLKALGLIKSYQVTEIKERKIPLALMTILFYALGRLFYNHTLTQELANLFFGTSLSLIMVYALFLFKLKSSLHVLSFGNAIGFFLFYSLYSGINVLPIVAILFLLGGILGASRLHLKAHTSVEVYVGFFLGMIGQTVAYFL